MQPGRTLGLIGGNVLLEGGNLTAAGGRIELGSVMGVGEVSLTPSGNRFVLGYDAINSFGNISLSNGAFVDASGEGGGDIQLRGGRLEMQNSDIWADTLGAGNGKEVLVRVPEIDLSDSFLTAEVYGTGGGGNLTIDTGRLLVRDGAVVSAATRGEGNGGRLQINADDSVKAIGTPANGEFPTGFTAESTGSGDAGDLTINTGCLLISDGAGISTSTFSTGNGASLHIVASDSVEIIGTSIDGRFISGLTAQSAGSGDAGDLTIVTGRLLVSDRLQVSNATLDTGNSASLHIVASDSVDVIGPSVDGRFTSILTTQSLGNSGEAGDLTIETGRLLVSDGAQVSTNTRGEGNGGSLKITASDSVEVTGASKQFSSALGTQSEGSGDAGDLTIETGRLVVSDGAGISTSIRGEGNGGSLKITADDSVKVTGKSADDGQNSSSSSLIAESEGVGDAGNLTIKTGRLLVGDGAVVSSSSLGSGVAGDINITARDTLQADNGTISTNTRRSSGGAIAIKAGNIRLFGNSDIRTDVASGAGGGGNITLKADSIVALGDSDILAFASDRGGNITLNTPAFFGEYYRPAPPNTNSNSLTNNNQVDINATGAVSGIITIPDVSFIQNSLIELPENQINTDSLLANSCIVRRNQPTSGSFTITGTGGLPQRPGDAQMSSFPTVDVATLPSDDRTPSNTSPNRAWRKGDPIIEPQGVYRLPNGKLVLSREWS